MSDRAAPIGFVMDRALPRELLVRMRTVYPRMLLTAEIPDEFPVMQVLGNLHFLWEHNLASVEFARSGAHFPRWGSARITAAGLDFLEQDGGLTAILGVVTVKLHADTVRDLLLVKVDKSDLPPSDKSKLRKAVEGASSAVLQAASKDLLNAGI